MHRLFLPPEELTSDEVVITGDNARHLVLVLRIEAGEPIEILDGNGHKYTCTVNNVHKKEVVVRILNKENYSVESPVAVTLAQGIAKGGKMDLIIQKSTELGVSAVIPVITERSQVRNTKKLERWKKIAASASQQSGRDKIPEIFEPVELKQLLTPPDHPLIKGWNKEGLLKLILSESYKEQNLKKILKAEKDINQVLLLIGPEGGFSKEEITSAIKNGFVEVSLGPRILRTETAPIAIISIIQYELGDMGQYSFPDF
jgi:16S rRNA (uracil1498-N3)-methyltransferase